MSAVNYFTMGALFFRLVKFAIRNPKSAIVSIPGPLRAAMPVR